MSLRADDDAPEHCDREAVAPWTHPDGCVSWLCERHLEAFLGDREVVLFP